MLTNDGDQVARTRAAAGALEQRQLLSLVPTVGHMAAQLLPGQYICGVLQLARHGHDVAARRAMVGEGLSGSLLCRSWHIECAVAEHKGSCLCCVNAESVILYVRYGSAGLCASGRG